MDYTSRHPLRRGALSRLALIDSRLSQWRCASSPRGTAPYTSPQEALMDARYNQSDEGKAGLTGSDAWNN